MPKGFKEVFWSADSIAEQWINENCVEEIWPASNEKDLESLAEKIARTFRRICKKYMGENKELVKWYPSKSARGIRGMYLFGDKAPELMKDLFILSRIAKGGLLEEEKEWMCEDLTGLLPLFRDMDEIKIIEQALSENNIEWDRKDHSLLNIKPESIEPGFMTKVMTANTIKELLTKSSEAGYYEQSVRDLLDHYYIEQEMGELFHDRIFVEADTRNGKNNRGFYLEQYTLVREWADKWRSIVENTGAVRIAERFEDSYEELTKNNIGDSERKAFYKEGSISTNIKQNCYLETADDLPEEELYECLLRIYRDNLFSCPVQQILYEHILKTCREGTLTGIGNPDCVDECLLKIYREALSQSCQKKKVIKNEPEGVDTKETCREECEKIVYDIAELFSKLENISTNDFKYLKNQAVSELEEIHKKIEKGKHEIQYFKETGRKAADIELLRLVRAKRKEIEKGKTILERAGIKLN